MSEPTTQQPNEVAQAEVPANGPETPVEEQTTFDAEYVHKLRDESAANRTKARELSERVDDLSSRVLALTVEHATGDILRDPADLPADGDYFDEDGVPSLEKIKAAAEELVKAKPYLGQVRGEVQQSARPQEMTYSLGSLIRDRIGA